MNVVNDRVQIPVELLSYVQKHKLVKPFSVFIYLKCMSTGIMPDTDSAFTQMPKVLGIKDQRTLNKHIQKLIDLNWLGFNTTTGEYIVRGISFIRKQQTFKKRNAVTFYFRDIKKMQAFVAGSLIASNIKSQQYFWEVAKRGRLKSAIMNLDIAQQDEGIAPLATTQKPAYYGLGIHGIAKILFCKSTRACELKQEAEKGGFIKTRERVKVLHVFTRSDLSLKPNLQYAYPEYAHKLKFRKVTKKVGKKKRNMVALVMQLHDEIKPKMDFKRIKRFIRLNSPTKKSDKNFSGNSKAVGVPTETSTSHTSLPINPD